MNFTTVLLDLKGTSAPSDKPLLLHDVLFCPVLTWLCQELSVIGAQRFFVVCHPQWQQEVKDVTANFADVRLFDDADAALSGLDENVLVIPSAVLPVNAFSGSPVYTASADDLRCSLAAGNPLTQRPEDGEQGLELLPIRTVAELQRAMPVCRDALAQRLAEHGVTIMDPTNTYIDPRCVIARDVTILPGTILRGSTLIGRGCEIGPNTMIRDCVIGEYTTVNASQLNESRVGKHTTVGPFAYLRPKCAIGDNCRVGDFVEVKNSVIGDGTKISHLTYVGDSDVGKQVNFGCGTVTTNYDGHRKYRCSIGDRVFLGCNTNLIAPVSLGSGAYTAAGSTITDDVPPDALAIAREKQTNKDGWAARFRASWEKK